MTNSEVKVCYISETYQNYEEARRTFPDLEVKYLSSDSSDGDASENNDDESEQSENEDDNTGQTDE
jgi:hypothetical protein